MLKISKIQPLQMRFKMFTTKYQGLTRVSFFGVKSLMIKF